MFVHNKRLQYTVRVAAPNRLRKYSVEKDDRFVDLSDDRHFFYIAKFRALSRASLTRYEWFSRYVAA